MTITVSPITSHFVAEIGDVDLTRPVSDDDFTAIADAFWKYAVLICPDLSTRTAGARTNW